MSKYCILLIISTFLFACKGGSNQAEDSLDDKNTQEIINKEEPVIKKDTSNLDTLDVKEDSDTTSFNNCYSDTLLVNYVQVSDTMKIEEECVLFLWPDSLEIAELKEKFPQTYLDIIDSMIYKTSQVSMELENAGIKNFFCDRSVIYFNDTNKELFLKRKQIDGNMLFYKKGKEVIISNVIEFDINKCLDFFSNVKNDTILSIN